MPSRFADKRDISAVEDLTPIEREQLRVAGERYDGEDLDAADRLAGDDEETGFLGFCALWRVVDGAEHRYDAWLYQVDSGTIFHAGTTDVAAEIVQFGLEAPDPAVRAELGPALVAAGLLPPGDSGYGEFAELLRAQEAE